MKERELLDTFIQNEDKIKMLMPDQERMRLPAQDLFVFKNKLDDIIG